MQQDQQMNTKTSNISDVIKNIEDEFNQDKVNDVFKPVFQIINDKEKFLQRKLQLLHNTIVAMRKDFDSMFYYKDVKERNKELNRLKYHRKKQEMNKAVIEIKAEESDYEMF